MTLIQLALAFGVWWAGGIAFIYVMRRYVLSDDEWWAAAVLGAMVWPISLLLLPIVLPVVSFRRAMKLAEKHQRQAKSNKRSDYGR